MVANEIKELAQADRAATEDIKARIAGVQSSTAGGIAEIEKVSQDHSRSQRNRVFDRGGHRGAGHGDQRYRAQHCRGLDRREGRQQAGGGNLAGDGGNRQEIVGVDQAAGDMADGSDQVQTSATELSRVAEQLQTTVHRFQV